MDKEHSVITFLKTHGKDIVEKGRHKYEPLRKESKPTYDRTIIGKEEIDYLQLKLVSQGKEMEKIKEENNKLKTHTNEEWFIKYKKYKGKHKIIKKEFRETKIELMQIKETLQKIENELDSLREENKRLKGKTKIDDNQHNDDTSSDSDNSRYTTDKIVNFIEESENEDKSEMEKENNHLIQALEKMKNVNAIIEEEPESDVDDYNNEALDTELETDDIVNEDTNDYPEEELVDTNLEMIVKKHNKMPNHIPIGQQAEFKEFIGSMSQGVNLNGYFLDLDNVYESQEIGRRITDWNLGTYLALMSSTHTDNLEYVYDLISKTLTGKVAYWVESIAYELKGEVLRCSPDWKSMLNIFDMILKREFLGEPWIIARDQVLVERKMEIIMNLNNMKCCKISKLPEYTISFSKFFYEARFLPEEGLIYQQLYYDHLPEPYNTEITKEYTKLEPRENTLGERVRVLRSYLMKKCEEHRIQQKVKKDKKLGLREICGLTEKRLVFGCDEKGVRKSHRKYRNSSKKRFYRTSNNNQKFNPYYNNYKRKKFRRFKNTINTRNRFRNKRKFRKRPYKGKEKISECKCWNCNEKGHYANKCPKLSEKRIRYINTSQFIMSLEQIKENDKKWYEYEDFYISETDPESESESETVHEASASNSSSD